MCADQISVVVKGGIMELLNEKSNFICFYSFFSTRGLGCKISLILEYLRKTRDFT